MAPFMPPWSFLPATWLLAAASCPVEQWDRSSPAISALLLFIQLVSLFPFALERARRSASAATAAAAFCCYFSLIIAAVAAPARAFIIISCCFEFDGLFTRVAGHSVDYATDPLCPATDSNRRWQ